MAKAEDLFNNFDSFETVVEEPDKNFIAKRTWHEDTLPIVVSKYRVAGLTEETMQRYFNDSMELNKQMNPGMETTRIEDHQGYKMYHNRMQTPMIMSNRTVIPCEYTAQSSDGYTCLISSSQGNEA